MCVLLTMFCVLFLEQVIHFCHSTPCIWQVGEQVLSAFLEKVKSQGQQITIETPAEKKRAQTVPSQESKLNTIRQPLKSSLLLLSPPQSHLTGYVRSSKSFFRFSDAAIFFIFLYFALKMMQQSIIVLYKFLGVHY